MFFRLAEFLVNIFDIPYWVSYLWYNTMFIIIPITNVINHLILLSIYFLCSVTINQNIYFEGLYLASSSIASAMGNLLPAITFIMAYIVG